MTETFDKLKTLLAEKKTLTNDDIQNMVKEHGEMTGEEFVKLEAEKLEIEKTNKTEEITLEAYQAALKVLDTADEGSEEYKKAEAIADKFESGA